MNRALLVAAILAVGCSATHEEEAAPPLTCSPGYEPRNDVCTARVDACNEGELPKIGGGCLPVGARSCGEGFTADGKGSCDPLLPKTACAAGQMAIPGETTCRPVAPCGEGTWGSIADEPGMLHVDASSAEGGDGSRGKPFKTIGAAVAAAKAGAKVAIAAGTYPEDLKLERPIELIGRCPSMVTIFGQGSALFAIDVVSSVTVRAISVRGPETGIGIAHGNEVLLDRVHVHDCHQRGIDIEDGLGRPKVTLRDSLVEANGRLGVFAQSASLLVEKTVVRDTKLRSGSKTAEGILARVSTSKEPSVLTVKRSVVERNVVWGIAVSGSKASIVESVIRETRDNGAPGVGIAVYADASAVPDVLVERVLVDRARGLGIESVDATLRLVDVTVRDAGSKKGSAGVSVDGGTLDVKGMTVERAVGHGLFLDGVAATFERLLVRDTLEDPSGTSGIGCLVFGRAGEEKTLSFRSSLFARNVMVGLAVGGTTLHAVDVAVLDTRARADRRFGDGLSVMSGRARDGTIVVGRATLERLLVRNSARAGLAVFASDAKVRGSLVSCNAVDLEVNDLVALGGDGERITHPVTLLDEGENACGCAIVERCKARSMGLDPIAR